MNEPTQPPTVTRPFDARFRSKVEDRLERFERQEKTDPELTTAGVAIVLTANEDGEASFLLTRRKSGLRRHSGQWALPGGRADGDETAVDAAIRETREEISLRIEPENVLGLLDDFATRSGFRMTPVICWVEPGQTTKLDPIEVDQLHVVPLCELERPEVPVLESIPESDRPVLSVPLPIIDQRIYTPTAAILFQLREVVLGDRATRVDHYEQPLFAWK